MALLLHRRLCDGTRSTVRDDPRPLVGPPVSPRDRGREPFVLRASGRSPLTVGRRERESRTMSPSEPPAPVPEQWAVVPARPTVLVPVKGTETDAPLLVAAREAGRLGAGLHLLHVVPPPPAEAYVAYADIDASLVAAADDIVGRTAATARRLVGDDVPVTTEVAHLEYVGAAILARVAAPCALVVMATTRRGRLSRIFTGSTTASVAARCPVPLLVVPAGASPTGAGPSRVVVGLHDTEQSPEVLVAALRQARLRGSRLLVVHVWCLDDAYAGMALDDDRADAEFDRARGALRAAIAPVLAPYPEVEVDVEVTEGPAVEALVTASADDGTDVLVIGRHSTVDPDHPYRAHLGSTARAVLQHAACPVLVVDPRRPSSTPGEDETLQELSHAAPVTVGP